MLNGTISITTKNRFSEKFNFKNGVFQADPHITYHKLSFKGIKRTLIPYLNQSKRNSGRKKAIDREQNPLSLEEESQNCQIMDVNGASYLLTKKIKCIKIRF